MIRVHVPTAHRVGTERGSSRGVTLLIVLLLLSSFVAGVSAVDASIAGDVRVKGLTSMGEKEFFDIFGIRAGSLIDEAVVRTAIKTAFLKGIFDDIRVLVGEGEHPVVTVTVVERDFIRKILVEGDCALSGSVVKDLFLLKREGIMRYDLLDAAVGDLKDKISGIYGFPLATVTAEIRKTETPDRVDVVLTVNTNAPATVESIRILLEPSDVRFRDVTADEIRNIMELGPGDRFDHVSLDRDLKSIRAFLKEGGYFNPSVGPFSIDNGRLSITVRPGKHLSVNVEGNSAIPTKVLVKEMPFFEIEDFSESVVEETILRMISVYHREGYPFVRISPAGDAGKEEIKITFSIVEGPKIETRTIRFVNAGVPVGNLKDVMALKEGEPYNPDLIEKDSEAIKEFYGALGYLDAVDSIDTKIDRDTGRADITVDVKPGEKTIISSVEVSGASPEMMDKLIGLPGIKAGDPYNDVDIANARTRIIAFLAGSGYPDAGVSVERTVHEAEAAINFKVDQGRRKYFGKTVVSGNWRTRYGVIERELIYREGDPYNFGILTEQRQRLYRLGVFTDVEIETVPVAGDRNDVIINVREANPGSVEFGFGYGEYEKFRGFVEVSYGNLWGMDREARVRTEVSSLEKRIILQYTEPWFMGSPKPLKSFFFFENKKELNLTNKEILYRLKRFAATTGTEIKMSPPMKGALIYEFSLVRTFDVQPDVVLSREDTGTLAISSVKPAVIYDTRDNPADPGRGILGGASAKIAPFFLLSEARFIKIEAYGSSFHRLGKRVTVAFAVRGGVAYGWGDTEQLPIVERYFLGGGSTVRGYEQDTLGPKGADGNPTGGDAFLMGNFELRTSIGRGISLVPFLDMGNVWIKPSDMDPTDLKYTTGIGLRYGTPVGPLRVDYGYKLNREPGESSGAVHFSIGQAF